jgi:glycerol uptake facilitator-like aquaporin
MDQPSFSLGRRLFAEFLGSALLATVVVGSGISAQSLSHGQIGLELLESALATGAGLFAIIVMFGAVSGAHLNPVVSGADAILGGIRWRDALAYMVAQVAGCVSGVILANLMYARPPITLSTTVRASPAHFLSEVVATAGLIILIFALTRTRRATFAAAGVGAYIASAYFFTSSTSFANPAITVGRMFTNTFAGIAPSSVPAFIGAEIVGGLVAVAITRVLYPGLSSDDAARAVVPHDLIAESGPA